MYPDFMLSLAGDEQVNWFTLLAEIDELHRIEQMLDERAGWTAVTASCIPAGPAERVAAVLRVLEMRSEIKEIVSQ